MKKLRFMPMLLSIMMVFTMMPMMAQPAYADDPAPPAPGIALGSDVLSVGSNTSGAATVHMADKAWRVIGYGENSAEKPQVASSAETMTLISAGNLKTDVQFRADWEASDANHYSKSNLKNEIEALTDEDNGIFSKGEKEGIVARDLAKGDYTDQKPYTNGIAGDEVKGALLWPLSTQEAFYMDIELWRASKHWWLRSPGDYNYLAACVDAGGYVLYIGDYVYFDYGVRPAFNFNLKSVIFTSAAEGGKSSEEVGAGALKPVGSNSTNDWKLTVQSGHEGFKITSSSYDNTNHVLTVYYSGAVTSPDGNEHVSAVVVDKDGKITHYGNIKQCKSDGDASGQIEINLDGVLTCGNDTEVYVFNEQLNGDKKTDYASKLIEITVPATAEHNYLWEYVNDGEHKGVCDKCGGEITEEHTYNQGHCTVCNGACGHSSLNDSYSHDPEKHWKTCAYCGNVIEHEEHAWQDEWTADGTKHWHECEVCQRKKDEENHKWDVGKVTKEATEKADGVKTYTCTVCKAAKTAAIPKLTPSGIPLAKAAVKKKSMTIGWNKIQGAEGYDIFFATCNHSGKKIACKNVKTIKGNKTFKWTKSGLKKGTAYNFYVRAYVTKNGKKTYVSKTPMFHAYTGNGTKNYTNAKSVTVKKAKVTLKKGKTYKIKASVKKMKKNKKLMPKSHVATLRYLTSDSKVATISKKGKITAKGKGSCVIYVFAHNGVSKQVKIAVR